MKKGLAYILTFLVLSFLFQFCLKRPFSHVRFKGILIDFFTNQPLSARVQFWTDNSSIFNKSGILKECDTNADGSFEMKSGTVRKKEYYASYSDKNSSYSSFFWGGSIPNNNIEDIGVVYTDHKFTCQLTINSISNNSISIDKNVFYPGTNSIFTHTTMYSKFLFDQRIGNYKISYNIDSTDNNRCGRVLNVPIASSNLTATLNF